MSFLDGVLPDPAVRVRHTLTRDLELRRSDERAAARFSGYRYRGGADFVLREGKFWRGRMLPEQYEPLVGPMSLCFANALAACDADPSLRYCEGYMTSGAGKPIVHGWCVAPDGGVVEVTLPATPEAHARSIDINSYLPFVPPDRWSYYGVTFDTALVHAHDDTHGLPMLDRSYAELTAQSKLSHLDMSEVHDFPILKVPYDPNRTELPQ